MSQAGIPELALEDALAQFGTRYFSFDMAFAKEYGLKQAVGFGKLVRLHSQFDGRRDDDGDHWVRLTLDEWAQEVPIVRRTLERLLPEMCRGEKPLFYSRTFGGRALWYRVNPDLIDSKYLGRLLAPDGLCISAKCGNQLRKMRISITQNAVLPNNLSQEPSPPNELDEFFGKKPDPVAYLFNHMTAQDTPAQLRHSWNIESDDEAMCVLALCKATGWPVPAHKNVRKQWLHGVKEHLKEFGSLTSRLYDPAWKAVRGKVARNELTITHPLALTFQMRAEYHKLAGTISDTTTMAQMINYLEQFGEVNVRRLDGQLAYFSADNVRLRGEDIRALYNAVVLHE